MAAHRGSNRVHIRDVAARAGVSLGTVSNVLNSKDSVAPELAERVRESMRVLGFVPNDNARQLKSRANQTIGLLVLSSYNAFFSALADAAEEAAEERNHALILAGSLQRSEREQKYLEMFERQRVGGILLAPIAGITPTLRSLHGRGTPVVLLGHDAEDFCGVSADTEMGGYLAAQHLIEQGRRDLLCVGGPEHQVSDRLAGARRAAGEHDRVAVRYMKTADLTVREGESAAQRILRMPSPERPDGVFALNDLLAIGMLNGFTRDGGLAVPGDISLIGHDDIDFASLTQVPLTTIRQPIQDIARSAIELALIEGEQGTGHDHQQRRFVPELVVRRTSLPVAP